MADEKLTQLTLITGGDVSLDDILYIVDNPEGVPESLGISVETLRDVITTLIGTRFFETLCFYYTESVEIANGVGYIHIPAEFNGWNLTYCRARVITPGTTNANTIQIYNVTDSVNMLSTPLSISSGASLDDGNRVIDTTHDDVATDDLLEWRVTGVSVTAPKGLISVAGFTRP